MRVLLYFITTCILLVSPSILSSQMVSNGNGLTDYYPPAFTQPIIPSHNPGSEWPDCTEPKNITVAEDRDNYIISWDGDERLSSKYYYELSIDDDSRSDENITSFKNIYKISKSSFGRSGKDQIKIRRVCYTGVDKKFYSNWVSHVMASPSSNCNITNGGGTLSAPNLENCFCTNQPFTITGTDAPPSCAYASFQWYRKSGCKTNTAFVAIPGAIDINLNTQIDQETMFKRVMNCPSCTPQQYELFICMFVPNISITNNECHNSRDLKFNSGCNLTSNTYNWSNGATTNQISVPRSAGGTYTCSVTLASGCTDVISKEVLFKPRISIDANSLNISVCNNSYFTISGSFSPDIDYTGNITIKYNNISVFNTNGTFLANSQNNFTTTNILANGTSNNKLSITESCTIQSWPQNINAPQPCASTPCIISPPSLSPPSSCTSTTFNLPFSCNVQNAEGRILNATIGQNSTSLTVPSNGNVSGIITGIPYNTSGPVSFYISDPNGCNESVPFTSPSSGADCNPTYCGVNYIGGYCNGSNYFVTGSIVVNNPVPGSTVYVTDNPSGNSVAIPMVAGTNIYNFDITNITPDGAVHTLTMNGTPCGSVTPSTQYNAPAACTGAANCLLGDFNASSGPCDPTTNQFTVSGSFTIDCSEPDLFTISIPDHGKQILIPTTPGQTTYPFSIPGLPANGASFQLLFTSQLNGSGPVMITAPQSCTNTPTSKCGDPYTLPPPPTEDLLDRSNPGDIFTVAGIPFQVTTVSGSNGIFSGEGRLVTPFSSTRLK